MSAIVEVVLPVFAIMLAGYLGGRFGLLGQPSSEALNRFVYFAALPALFFVSIARVELGEAFNLPFLLAYGGGVVITAVVAVLVARFAFQNSLGGLTLHGLSATFANVGYLGIPLLLTAYGEAATLPAIVATVFSGTVMMGIGVALLELSEGLGQGPLAMLKKVLLGIVRSPLVVAALIGIAFSLSGLALPTPLATFCDILGAAAAPCALFAIGLFMVGKSFTAGAGEVSWLVVLKLFVQPAVTWWLATRVFEMEAIWATSAVILAALPTAALVFVLAQQYEVYIQRSTAAIMVSTVLSVLTLSLLFPLLG